jgi:hypothetical protein
MNVVVLPDIYFTLRESILCSEFFFGWVVGRGWWKSIEIIQ